MNRLNILILFCSLAPLFSFGQSLSFSDKYNLNFKVTPVSEVSEWTCSVGTSMPIFSDSIPYNGKKPFLLKRLFLGKKPIFDIKGSLQQCLPILCNVHKGEIYLTAKTENIKIAEWIVAGKNREEQLMYSDTISFSGAKSWQTLRHVINLENISLLYIELRLQGEEDDKPHSVTLDKIEIVIDGKNVDEYLWNTVPIYPTITNYKSLSSESIDEMFFGKKIIGLGESVHGCKTMNQYGIKIMKQFITRNTGNLILMEIPLEWTCSINRYIAGDMDFAHSDAFQLLKRNFFSYPDLMDFIEWLRAFNAQHNRKIYLAGIDHGSEKAKRSYLFDYFYLLNKKHHLSVLDSICSDLINGNMLSVVLDRFTRAQLSSDVISTVEKRLLMYCLDEKQQYIKKSNNFFVQRDSMMFQNTEFLMRLLGGIDSKAIIYTHLLHSNNQTCDPTSIAAKSLGSFLRKKYDKAYTCIGLLGKTGYCLSLVNGEYKNVKLETPPINSMEASLCKIAMPAYYVFNLPSTLTYIRNIGGVVTNYLNQFYLCNPAQYMDSVIFIDTCEVTVLDKEVYKMPYELELIEMIRVNKEKCRNDTF